MKDVMYSQNGFKQALRGSRCKRFDNMTWIPLDELNEAFKKSTVEVEPIIHAHWEFVEREALWITDIKEFGGNGNPSKKNMPVCSNCKTEYGLGALKFKRCPECGAHMDTHTGDEKGE